MKKLSRRKVLRGLGGAVLGLPFLDAFELPKARAAEPEESFAIFFRQANGVAQAQETIEIGSEPERFWPRDLGALTLETMTGRAVDELVEFRDKLLMVQNVNAEDYDFGGCGHARGAFQCLTARGPWRVGAGSASEAGGESLDHRIGRELNPVGRDSLFLYAGQTFAYALLGGPCISHRGPGQRRAATQSPWNAYRQIVGGETGLSEGAFREIADRQRSINDLVREQMNAVLRHPRLSGADKHRLDLHFGNIRDLEKALTCRAPDEALASLENIDFALNTMDGDEVLALARLHIKVAAMAVACGHTRSVCIQVGAGNDALTRYRHPETGALMDNFHYISHRRTNHDSTGGSVIAGSDLLHHYIDRQFARTFRDLIATLDGYVMPSGGTLLDKGIAYWFNDLSNGPEHGYQNLPTIVAGSANGFLRQGELVRVGGTGANLNRLMNTIGTAVGVRKENGDPLDDFGDPDLPGGLLDELLA